MRFIHTGDIHLGANPGYSDVLNEILINNQKRAFLNILKEGEGCDFILICGDLFDSPAPSPEILSFAVSAFCKLSLPVYIAAGNHDPLSAYKLCAFPENVHIFSPDTEKLSFAEYDLYGSSFSASHKNIGSLADFRADNPDKINIMALHGEVKADSFYNPLTTAEIEKSGLDYLALAHIHKPSTAQAGKTVFAYCGTPQAMSFRDCHDCFINSVEIGNKINIVKKRVCMHSFAELKIDISDCLSDEDIISLIGENPNRLVKAELCGKENENFTPDTDRLSERLNEKFLFASVRLNTRKAFDIENIKNEQSLRGEFVRQAIKNIPSEFLSEVLEEGLTRL